MSEVAALPGDKIASIEEYEAGYNTFDDGDMVRAAAVGKTDLNKETRVASVKHQKMMSISKVGDIIIGTVDSAREVIPWTRHRLTAANLDWLGSLPAAPLGLGHGITIVHASLRDPVWEYLVTREIAKENLAHLETPFCLNGHSHLPVLFRWPWQGLKILEEPLRYNEPVQMRAYDRLFINPGSVGQPRDEDPRAAYALIDLEAMTLTLRRVQYDFTVTQGLMKQAKFPSRLIRRLRFGQ